MPSRQYLSLVLLGCVLLCALCGCGRPSGQSPRAAQGTPPAALPNRTVHVLCYHNITAKPATLYDTSIADFTAQLEALQAGGYKGITATQLAAYLASEQDLPDKSVLITFDDGRASFLRTARPVLERYGFTATLFLITGAVGTGGNLTWDDARSLQQAGYEFGSHTVSHLNLTRLARGVTPAQLHQRVRRELLDSAAVLSKQLGRLPAALAYPYGNYDGYAMQTAREAGYRLAFTIDPGAVDNQSSVWTLPRQMIVKGTSRRSFDRFLATEPLHVAGIEPRVGERLPARQLKLSVQVTDPDAFGRLGVEAGKGARLQEQQGTGLVTVTAMLDRGANRVRLFSDGTPRRETGWLVVCDPK